MGKGRFNWRPAARAVLFPLLAIAVALFVGALFIEALGFNWVEAYRSLLKGSVGGTNAIAETLIKATPLLFAGLSFAVGIRCGLINLGAEGQVYMGGLFATFVGIRFSWLPPVVHLPLTILAGAVGGGLLGLLLGWMKNRFGASEMITGIMFNYIATWLVSWAVTGPMMEAGNNFPQTEMVAEGVRLPRIFPATRLHLGFVLALLGLVLYYVFLWKTTKGFELRLTGQNLLAAEYAGINIKRNILVSMFLSGCFAGLAGTNEILGIQHRLFQGFSPGYGFDGISVALLGSNNPIGILLSGTLFGLLQSGSNKMQINVHVPSAVVQVIQALVLFMVVGRGLFGMLKRRKAGSKAEGGA